MDACIHPMPLTLVGENVHARRNFMTVALVNRGNFKPSIMTSALNKSHYTTEGIRNNSTFSIKLPITEMIEVVDYCGIVLGKKADKSVLFEVSNAK
jgi:flavin reductase (DIM6/NTAB) family NADH-FMN oxidoreductase RutF